MKRRTTLVCLVALAAVMCPAAHAEHTRYWRQADFPDFEKGTATGVAIRSDGTLVPAPKFESFTDPDLAYVWALRLDHMGRLYAAGGSDAKVLRFDASGKAATVFSSADLAAQAIAFDSKDNLYVATSPDGKVYRVTPGGTKTVFFDPKAKYIWSLAFDSHGDLFVGTGDKGQVFVVAPDGTGRLFYQTDELHARTLAFDSKGNLLIGTDPHGLIVRVPIERNGARALPTAGSPFVLYETDKQEVTALIEDRNGNLYAAAVGNKRQRSASPFMIPTVTTYTAPVVVTPSNGGTRQTRPRTTTPSARTTTPFQFPFQSLTGGAEVVKIAPDGSPTTVWTSRTDLVFSMAFSPTGKLLLGTGNNGTIFEMNAGEVYSSIAKTASGQVTSMVAASDGKMYVATANPGKIFTLGPGYQPNGTFASQPFDAKIFSHWGRIIWWGNNGGAQGKVSFYVRTGNTSTPDKNWSHWAGPYMNASGSPTDCPPARFAQWKAVFLKTDGAQPPDISWVSLAYLRKNVAPVIDDIALQDPGVRVIGLGGSSGLETPTPVQLRMPQKEGSKPSSPPRTSRSSHRAAMEAPPQGLEADGYQSVLWTAHDANGDDMDFSIFYRAEGERTWHLLKDKLTHDYYSWNTATMPDGAYYLKITASDSPSNPPSMALSASRISDRFVVANTPPRIENLHAGAGILSTKASFDAVSTTGPIAVAKYSLDAGGWRIIFPTTMLSDSPKESYYLELPGLPAGQHTLAVQVQDRFGNTATDQITFTVLPRTGH